MNGSLTGKVIFIGLIALALAGAGTPKKIQQLEEEKTTLRNDLKVLRRCGQAQIQNGTLPKKMFDHCAEIYQKFGLTLFPSHHDSSSSEDGADLAAINGGTFSSAMPTNTATIPPSSGSSSSASSAPSPTRTCTPIPTTLIAIPPTATATPMVIMTLPMPTSTATTQPLMTYSPIPTQTSTIALAQPTISLLQDGGGGTQPIS